MNISTPNISRSVTSGVRFPVNGRKFIFILIMSFIAGAQCFATAWTTGAAGAINTLANWTDGASGTPSSFTTPGDTWTVTLSMTLPASATWNVGTAASTASTVTFATGGTMSMSGAGSTFTVNIYGDLVMNGGTISLGGAGTTCNFNVNGTTTMNSGAVNSIASTTILNMNTYGAFNMSGGSTGTSGASSGLNWNTHGPFTMTGGSFIAGGAGASVVHNIYGNCSFSGTSAMTSTGAGTNSTVHLALPSASGTMLIDNISTGTWSGTNVFVDAGCTAQLDGNFSTTTGTATFGLTVNGTLICPAAYIVNGTRKFVLSSLATLVVAHPLGINEAIATTGSLTFNQDANYTYNGAVVQNTGTYLPVSLISPSALTISNAAGVNLTQSVITTGTLAFTAGILNTGSYTMSTPGAAGAVTGAGAASYVNGTLIKTISSYTSVNYEVGDVNYAPMLITLSSAGTAGSLGMKVTNGLHPSVATSGLSSANMANHYWTITNYAATGPATIVPKATYNVGDILGGSNTSFLTQEYAGAAWLGAALATTNTSTPYTSAPNTGIALATIAGQYIFGNLSCGTLPITGTPVVCVGATTPLADATPGGTWNSGATGIATVSSAGLVSGVAAGTAVISYTASGCTVSIVVTVSNPPVAGPITGVSSACVGLTTSLTGATPGGTWTSSNPAVGTVSTAGVVSGISAGTTIISYTVTNGCGSATATLSVTVGTSLSVAPITGIDSVCPGRTDTLHDITTGGVWSSTNTSLATVSATGVVTGVAPGYDTIVYTITNSCGSASAKFRIKVRNPSGCPTGLPSVAEITEDGLHVYPNPNTGNFRLSLSTEENEPAQVTITNVVGERVFETTVTNNSNTEITMQQPPGMYFISARTSLRRYVTKVMIR